MLNRPYIDPIEYVEEPVDPTWDPTNRRAPVRGRRSPRRRSPSTTSYPENFDSATNLVDDAESGICTIFWFKFYDFIFIKIRNYEKL